MLCQLLFFVVLAYLVWNGSALQLGKQKRALRAIANSLKKEKDLPIINCNKAYDPSPGFIKNLENTLKASELVQVKLKVEKRKDANALGCLSIFLLHKCTIFLTPIP